MIRNAYKELVKAITRRGGRLHRPDQKIVLPAQNLSCKPGKGAHNFPWGPGITLRERLVLISIPNHGSLLDNVRILSFLPARSINHIFSGGR